MTFALLRRMLAAIAIAVLLPTNSALAGETERSTSPSDGMPCANCLYDFSDLNNVIPRCQGGSDIGYVSCTVSGNYCTGTGECGVTFDEDNIALSLDGRVIVAGETSGDRIARRRTTLLNKDGSVPCAVVAADQASILVAALEPR